MVSFAHCIAHKDKYIAIVCAMVETENPEQEIVPALRLLGRIERQFVSVSEIFVPTDDGSADGVFVTESYDTVSHFESATSVARQGDVLHVCARLVGSDVPVSALGLVGPLHASCAHAVGAGHRADSERTDERGGLGWVAQPATRPGSFYFFLV